MITIDQVKAAYADLVGQEVADGEEERFYVAATTYVNELELDKVWLAEWPYVVPQVTIAIHLFKLIEGGMFEGYQYTG